MTATAARPATTRWTTPDHTLLPTVMLTVLTMSVAVGLRRLFADASFAGPVLVTALAVHLVSWAGRRARVSTLPAIALAAATTFTVTVWTVVPGHTAYGVPWKGAVGAAAGALQGARDAFADVAAPAEVLPGFVLASCIGIGVCAFMADWAAFRVGTPLEACLPAFTLFLFTSALASPSLRGLAVVVFAAAALAFYLSHQFVTQARPGAWFGGRRRAGGGAVLQTAAIITAVAAVIGLVIGPALPGAGSDPVVAYRGKDRALGRNNRTTISPLVDIRSRLVERRGTEVFTVDATQRAYWRITSLDTFNGNIWSSNDTYGVTRGALPSDVDIGIDGETIEQSFTIASLATLWLPHAYRPTRIQGIDGVSYNAPTGSLITESDTADGLQYRVTSRVIDPVLTEERLRRAPARAPEEIAERFLELPQLPPRVIGLAQELARGSTSQYEKARRLQDFFRGRFEYSLEADNGHDNRALERFLFETRAGYCEQFAGAYAVMARVMNLPARVAVGFTPGSQIDEDTYVVRDLNAHAWPEVYIEGFGWVAFEPTPGRGAPRSEAYTGVPEQQDSAPLEATPSPAETTPTTAGAGDDTPTTLPRFPEEDLTSGDPGATPVPFGRRILYAALILVVAVAVLWAGGVPALRARQRHRRRAEATTANDRVMVAWLEVVETLAQAGAEKRPAETIFEFARRAARVVGLPTDTSQLLRDLATAAAAASYGVAELPADTAERAAAAAVAVRQAVNEAASPTQRVLWELDPRPLQPSRD